VLILEIMENPINCGFPKNLKVSDTLRIYAKNNAFQNL
jgi:hypothetical protein